jgi:hypothetical protein
VDDKTPCQENKNKESNDNDENIFIDQKVNTTLK